MTTLAGVRIHPGFFNQRQSFKESRVGAASFKTKKTVVRAPKNPEAKHAMPVVAVVAAFVAVEAAVAATTIWSVITAVGAVTSAIGAVTGNKDLMKIGAIVGVAGAVGGFADSAGFFGDGGSSSASSASNVSGNPTGYESDIPIGGSDSSGLGNIGGQNLPPVDANGLGKLDPIGAGGPGDALTGDTFSSLNTPPTDAVLPPTDAASGTYTGATGVSQQATSNAYDPTGITPPPATPVIPSATPAATTPTAADQITANAQTPANTYGAPPPSNAASGTYTNAAGATQTTASNTLDQFKPATPFDDLMSGFSKLGSGVGKFAKDNPLLATSIFNGIAGAADPSQRALREAQAANLNSNASYTDQLKKNQSTVGGAIDWNKLFPGSGMISKAGK